MSPPERASRTGPAFLMLAALALLAALAIAPYSPRTVVAATAPAETFSAERALPHLEAIAQEPHPVGSAAHGRVRDYLLGQLESLGVQPEIQRAVLFRAPAGDGVVVENVLARLPGAASSGAVLLTAHYDSVENGPGAGDDGMAVAAMVETLRALRAGPALRNDLVLLFSDGEEPGLYGAQAFVERHPWAADVRVVFGFDGDAPTGPTTILWTTPRDGWLLREVAAAPTGLVAGPRDNPGHRGDFGQDLHVFAAAGFAGAHLDQIADSVLYHSERDSMANLEPAALQRQGDAMLALARHFGAIPLGDTHGDDAALVTGFGLPVATYPLEWTLSLTLVVGVTFVLAVGLGLRMRRLTLANLGRAALALTVGTGGLSLVARLAWEAALAAHPESAFFAERAFYREGWYLGAIYAFAFALVLVAGAWLQQRRVDELHVAAAGVAAGFVLSLGLAVAQPGAAYLALWPALTGALMLACLVVAPEPSSPRPAWTRLGVLIVAAAPIVGLMVGVLYEPVIGGLSEGPALPVAVLVVLTALLAPQIALAWRATGRWLPSVLTLAGVALLGASVATSGFSAAHPRPDRLLYLLDADAGLASWGTPDASLDEWTGAFLAGGVRRTLDELVGGGEAVPVLAARAPVAALPPPTLVLESEQRTGDVRTLRLHLASPRRAGQAYLLPGSGTHVLAASLGDSPPLAVHDDGLRLRGLPAEGMTVNIQLSSSGPARFTVVDWSSGVPDLPDLAPRPAAVMPAPFPEQLSGYPTMVRASFAFSPA